MNTTSESLQPVEYLTRSEVARQLRISLRQLQNLIQQGSFPQGVLVGRRKRIWSRRQIEQFLASGGSGSGDRGIAG
ncbi:MAG: helix-turn-helix domain-containing protein [Gemmataceae bacterium]|nr:helix-turn-helix domain-containing protein [Gemmataceae bacterium]